ncbi:MAG TPA: hypothetical protein VL728_19590 [Cyclobacteriaceae bacterium]|jgi:hypothetical protein|nr:hypothetical protein [Cyclobacteriaceae bacterium]
MAQSAQINCIDFDSRTLRAAADDIAQTIVKLNDLKRKSETNPDSITEKLKSAYDGCIKMACDFDDYLNERC